MENTGTAPWYVYIVVCADNTLYTGCTNNVEKRITTHNKGKGAAYTRSRLPVTLIYMEEMKDKSSALKREHAIKKLSRTAKLYLINQEGSATLK